MKSKYFFLIYVFFLLSSCQSIKDGLAGNKNENSDEFLIEKKNPLEIPPDFGVLPIPNKKNREIDEVQKIDEEIEKLLKKENVSKDDQNVGNSAEDFVLKQIKKN